MEESQSTFSQTARIFVLEQAWRRMAFAMEHSESQQALSYAPPRSCMPWHTVAPFHNCPAKGMPAPTADWEIMLSPLPCAEVEHPSVGLQLLLPSHTGQQGIPSPFPHAIFSSLRSRTGQRHFAAAQSLRGDLQGGWERHRVPDGSSRWEKGASRGCLCPPETKIALRSASSRPT